MKRSINESGKNALNLKKVFVARKSFFESPNIIAKLGYSLYSASVGKMSVENGWKKNTYSGKISGAKGCWDTNTFYAWETVEDAMADIEDLEQK